jgi:hypothetical protein
MKILQKFFNEITMTQFRIVTIVTIIERVCENSICIAFRRMANQQVGYRIFDLLMIIYCPIWKKFIEVKNKDFQLLLANQIISAKRNK